MPLRVQKHDRGLLRIETDDSSDFYGMRKFYAVFPAY